MKAPAKLFLAATVIAALGGCASGGGKPAAENAPLGCLFIPWACVMDPDIGQTNGRATSGAAQSVPAATPPARFVSWKELQDRHAIVPVLSVARDIDRALEAGTENTLQWADSDERIDIAVQGSRVLPLRGYAQQLSAAGQPGIEVSIEASPSPAPSLFTATSAQWVAVGGNPYLLGWDYQSFGVWGWTGWQDSARATSYGAPTPGSAVPTSGTASFTGKLAGLYVSPQAQGSVAAADLAVRVDFGARSLSFASTGTMLTRDFAAATAAPQLNLSGTLTYGAGRGEFAGTLRNAAGSMAGESRGKFYGPAAQELGGVFSLKSTTSPESFTGAYGAKR